MISEKHRIARAAATVGSITLVSRVFGYIRDMVIAACFGTGIGTDAFVAAFRIPDLMRRLFHEGALSTFFIPVFNQRLVLDGRPEAFQMARSVGRFVSLMLLLGVGFGILLGPVLMRGLAYGFVDNPPQLQLAIQLFRIMWPYVMFIGLTALSMGILNALDHFTAPALAPLVLNGCLIAATLWLSPALASWADPITGLAIGVTVGGCMQLLLQMPFLHRHGFYFWRPAPLWHPDLKRIITLMVPFVCGSAVFQINTFLITWLACFLPAGRVSALYFAERLVHFPLGLIGISVATAALPSFSRLTVRGDTSEVRQHVLQAMKLVLFLSIPATMGLIVLSRPIVTLLYYRGAFNLEAVWLTSTALIYYAIGLWALAASKTILPAFFAAQDVKTPLYAAFIAIGSNALLALLLVQPLSHSGLALAAAISAILHFGWLLGMFQRRFGFLEWRKLVRSVGGMLTAAAMMGTAVLLMANWMLPPDQNAGLAHQITGLLCCLVCGCGIYGLLAPFFNPREFSALKALMRKK